MPEGGETIQEIRFWLEFEGVLSNIEQQLKSPEAEVTLALLRQARRFHATAPFDSDTIGIKKAAEKGITHVSTMLAFIMSHLPNQNKQLQATTMRQRD